MTADSSRIITYTLILLFLVMTIGMVYSLSMETHAALKGGVQDKLISVASTAASQIDGDTFAGIQPGDENSDGFRRVHDQLGSIKNATPDIRYVYTMRKSGDGIVYVVDADYDPVSRIPSIGEPYPEAEEEMYAGFAAPIADR